MKPLAEHLSSTAGRQVNTVHLSVPEREAAAEKKINILAASLLAQRFEKGKKGREGEGLAACYHQHHVSDCQKHERGRVSRQTGGVESIFNSLLRSSGLIKIPFYEHRGVHNCIHKRVFDSCLALFTLPPAPSPI